MRIEEGGGWHTEEPLPLPLPLALLALGLGCLRGARKMSGMETGQKPLTSEIPAQTDRESEWCERLQRNHGLSKDKYVSVTGLNKETLLS